VKGQAQDIVLTGRGGLPMTPDDAASLLECLDAIAADPQEYSVGREYVARHFNRDDLAARMLACVLSVAQGEPPVRLRLEPPITKPAKAA
jgi:hypothetical protein